MTVKFIDNEDTPLLRNKPVLPPSQRPNEDVSRKEDNSDCDDVDVLLFSADLQAAIIASSLQPARRTTYSVLDPVTCLEDRNPNDHDGTVDFFVENVPTVETRVQVSESSSLQGERFGALRRNSSSSFDRRVSFAKELVSEVRTRPRTPPEDLRTLFYTYEETQRFRQEYRVERDVLNRADYDAESDSSTSLLLNEDEMNSLFGDDYSSTKRSNHKYDISRVVIMYNDVLETYDGLKSSCPSTNQTKNMSNGEFFDNDSFWSGSITWY